MTLVSLLIGVSLLGIPLMPFGLTLALPISYPPFLSLLYLGNKASINVRGHFPNRQTVLLSTQGSGKPMAERHLL